MKMKFGFVVGLVALATIYVTGCGDNPEKQRILPSSLEKLKTQFSDQEYIASSGNSFKIDKNNNAVEFKSSIEPQKIYAEINAAGGTIRIENAAGNFLFELPFKADTAAVQEITQILPNGTPAPVADVNSVDRFNFEITCQQVRNGTLTSLFQRPANLKHEYDNHGAQELFRTYPLAKMVGVFDISDGDSTYSYRLENLSQSSPASSLQLEEAVEGFQSFCSRSPGFDNNFSDFFAPTSSYSSDSNKIVPILRFDKIAFQTFDPTTLDQYTPIDATLFTTTEVEINVLPLAQQYFSGNFQSGRMIYRDELVKEFDAAEVNLDFDFSGMTFALRSVNAGSACTLELNGTIQQAIYTSRRKYAEPNTYIVKMSVQDAQANDCLPDALKGRDLNVVAYIASSQNEGEILVTLLDQNTQTTILSRTSFIKR